MAVDSLQDLVDEAQAIALGLQAARTEIDSALGDGSYTPASLRHLLASVTGQRANIRTLRRSLDLIDAVDYLRVQDGEHVIGLWRWQRTLRQDLISLDGAAAEVATKVAEFIDGSGHRIHVVRSGETLQSIAAGELGDWRQWRTLAELNGLSPGVPATGTILVVPARA